ncbi:dynamin family protein [Paraclostridium bifermentans]|uniref:dynamin family protein n=1 Tax=Paraclostridium bifermentans TaxID=1490 RepID=UPI00359C28FE
MNYYNREKVYKNISNDIKILNYNIDNAKLQIFNKTSQTYYLINQIENEINYIIKSVEELKDPFLLYVIGPGKYGKSTLINSLLRSKVLETRDIPNTWKIDTLINSSKSKIEIINDNDITYELNYEEGLKLIKNEEIKLKNSKKIIREKLEEYKNKNRVTIENLKKYKKKLEELYLYKSNICEVRYYIKNEGILKDFIIVDTPGLNQNLLRNTRKRMIDYYKRADGIIWILDSQNIVSKSSYDLLNELKEEYILDDKNNNIICAINKIDIIRNKEENICKIRDKVSEIYYGYFKDMIMISSKEAINGYINNDINLIELSNIEALIESIDINFKKQSEKMQIKSKYKNLEIMSRHCTNLINNYKRNFYYHISKADEIKVKIDIKIENTKFDIEKNIVRYLTLSSLNDGDIYSEIKELEDFLKYEINNLKSYLFNIAQINNDLNEKENFVQIDILHTKEFLYVKNNMKEYNQLFKEKYIKLNIVNKKVKEEAQKNKVINSIELLKKYIEEKIDKILIELKMNLDILIEKSFREKYVDYKYIKNHLISIKDIDTILKKWGSYNEKIK